MLKTKFECVLILVFLTSVLLLKPVYRQAQAGEAEMHHPKGWTVHYAQRRSGQGSRSV